MRSKEVRKDLNLKGDDESGIEDFDPEDLFDDDLDSMSQN